MVMQIPRLSRIWFYTGVICDVSNRRLWRLSLWFAEINGWLQLYQKFPGGNLRKCLQIKPHIVCVCVCMCVRTYTRIHMYHRKLLEWCRKCKWFQLFGVQEKYLFNKSNSNWQWKISNLSEATPPPPPHIQSAQSSSHIPSGRHIHWHTQPYFHSYALVHLQSCMLSSVTLRGWGLSASGNYEWLLSD